jgi:hypothetical protein
LNPKLIPVISSKLQAAGHVPAQALQAYDKAIQIDPQNNQAWFFRGIALGILAQTTETNKAFFRSKVLRNGTDDIALEMFNQAFILKDLVTNLKKVQFAKT